MPTNLNEETYRKLKKEVDFAKEEAQRAHGALDTMMVRLKDEFECTDLKKAKTKLETLEAQTARAEKEFEKALTTYQKNWKQNEE